MNTDEKNIITNTEEENRAVNPQDKSPEEAPTSKEASISPAGGNTLSEAKGEGGQSTPRENT